jgi:diguanylate cyclase (GGDEF)-like protein
MKEMIPGREETKEAGKSDGENTSRRYSTVERLANFIEEATRELKAANDQLSDMNTKLSNMAITDGMTKLFNRTEIQRRITECTESDSAEPASLIMLDIDNFKRINDTFGHKEGDNVICVLADLMRHFTEEINCASTGRWGGEEFMILLQGIEKDRAFEIAERIRKAFEAVSFQQAGHQTVSLGVTQRRESEYGDSFVLRVDQALYKAKSEGKNRTVLL